MPQTNMPQKNGKGYGGRPLWQWILLYVILAIIVYGVVYLVFFHHSGSGSGGSFSY